MKIISGGLLLVLVSQNLVFGHKFELPTSIPSFKTWLAETLTKTLATRLQAELRNGRETKDVQFTIYPPMDDPAILEPFYFPIDITFDVDGSPIRISGYFNLTEEATLTGLCHLVDDLVIKTPILQPIEIELNIHLPAFLLEGKHNIEFEIDLGTSKVLKGDGDLLIRFDNYFINLHAVTKTNGAYLGIASSVIDLGFQNLLIDGGDNVYIDDLLVDWVSFSDGLQTWFDTLWNDEVQGIINEIMTCTLNHMIGECTAADLVNGNLDCLRSDVKPECFGFEPLPTTTSATTKIITSPVPSTTYDPCLVNYGGGEIQSEGLNNFIAWAFRNYGSWLNNNRLDPTPPIIPPTSLSIQSSFLRLDGSFRNSIGFGMSNPVILESVSSDFLSPQLNFQLRLSNVSLHGLYNASGSVISLYPISGEGAWTLLNFSLDIYLSIFGFAIEDGFINIESYSQRNIALDPRFGSLTSFSIPDLVTPQTGDGLGAEVMDILQIEIPSMLQQQGKHPIVKSVLDYLNFMFSITPLSEIIATTPSPCLY